jgi:hypothetical protein
MFRLDYLSCLLTVLATILVGRKMWTGLVVSGLNSLIVCVIGLHTSQYGFIPANVFCICINAFSLRAWLKAQKDRPASDTDTSSGLLTGGKRMSALRSLSGRTMHPEAGGHPHHRLMQSQIDRVSRTRTAESEGDQRQNALTHALESGGCTGGKLSSAYSGSGKVCRSASTGWRIRRDVNLQSL